MKTRIIAAAVLIPVLLLILFVFEKMVAAIVFAVLLALGAYELLYRTGLVARKRMVVYAAVCAAAMSVWSFFGAVNAIATLMLACFMALLFMEMMLDHVKVPVESVCVCLFGGFVVPYMLTGLIRILMDAQGRFFIAIPFIIAFTSDAGAYFVGLRFGRHKLAPVVSPNKTIEGMLGGLAAATVSMLIYALILGLIFKFRVFYGYALIYGMIGSLAGVFGDLVFSVIKRQTGIKDYGNLIPGHGGFLDRFDSLVMVVPVVEALLVILPIALG